MPSHQQWDHRPFLQAQFPGPHVWEHLTLGLQTHSQRCWGWPVAYCPLGLPPRPRALFRVLLIWLIPLVKAMVFPVVMNGCESWIVKKAERQRIDAFELWCWRRLLRVPWTARRSRQSILKEISPEYSLEGLMLKLKLHYFGYLMRRTDPDAGKDWRWEEKGMTEDEMVGWHHQLNGHEFE